MKLTMFFSKDGDCILLTGADGKMVLADGGRSSSYTSRCSTVLDKMRGEGGELECVYISHIDADHVEGVEKMLEDLVDWEVFDFQQGAGSTGFSEPKSARPMKPKAIWHNSFHDQADENTATQINDLLAASATVLTGLSNSAPVALQEVAVEHANLATSMTQAFNISSKIKKNLLNIKLNPEFGGKLMMLSGKGALPKPIKIGGMRWDIIGPTENELEQLRDDWNKWLETAGGKNAIKKVKNAAAAEEGNMGNAANEVASIVAAREFEANMLAKMFVENGLAFGGKKSGSRNGVTVPNLASLSFMVQEKKGTKTQTVLMTGDAHWKDLIAGLERQKKFDADGTLHVDVLKMPHHGATANMDPEFLQRVTADHYVFCGISAKHHNPEEDVVNMLLDSRLTAGKKSKNKKVSNKFELWFNGSSKNKDLTADERAHIKKIEKIIKTRADAKFKATFLDGASFDLEV